MTPLFIAIIALLACAHGCVHTTGGRDAVVMQSAVNYESELGDTVSTDTTIRLQGLYTPRRNCKEIYDQLDAADRITGLYYVSHSHKRGESVVYCDMKLSGGGWTVIQRRISDETDFHESWTSYQSGFGKYSGNYWMGLDNIRSLTENGDMELWIGMESYESSLRDPRDKWRHARYGMFIVGDESSDYTLSIAGYNNTSTASDSLTQTGNHHNGKKFTTKDRDNDDYRRGNCAKDFNGGWWFGDCRNTNLNGKYYNAASIPGGRKDGISWESWWGLDKSLKTVVMAVRPK